MYRQYENPYRLEEWLSELNERINFAWQDEEFA